MTDTANPDLLTEEQAGALLSLKNHRVLATWRCRGYGPPFLRIGKAVRYRRDALLAWLDAQTVETE